MFVTKILKDISKEELDVMKIFYKRMGRDAVWEILEVLDDAEDGLTRDEICKLLSRKNIGMDLKFLSFIKVIKEGDYRYNDNKIRYGFNYLQATKYKNLLTVKKLRWSEFTPYYGSEEPQCNYIGCILQTNDDIKEFLELFKPKKRKIKQNKPQK